MAKHTHHEPDPSKKPDEENKPPVTPAAPVPNMSLEDEALPVEEVVEAEPIVVAPASEVLLAEPIEAAPVASDVVEVEPDDEIVDAGPVAEEAVLADEVIAETPAETPPVEAKPISDVAAEVVLADDVVELAGSSAVLAEASPVETKPTSEPDLMSLLAESAATPVNEPIVHAVEDAAPSAAHAEEPIASAPAPEIVAVHEEAASAPASEVVAAAEPIAPPPASETAAHEAIAPAPPADEHVAEAMPESAVVAEEPAELVEAMPESAVVAEEPAEAAPASGVIFDDEVAEAAPASAVVAEEAVEAMPESAVEAAEAMPESAVVAEEAVEAVEAMPESAVVAEEAVEAMPESAVEAAEAMPESAVVADEAVEEAAEVAPESAVVAEEAVEASESGVIFDEAVAADSGVKKKKGKDATEAVELDQTLAFEPPASAAKKADDDELVTEEELVGAAEASAVDLGDVPGKKGSSVTGIDKVAEALESGVDLAATAPPEPSVEFDEVLDEAAEVEEAKEPSGAKKKPGKHDKKKPASAKATGDDIDLDALFGEEEAAEAEEAEAIEEAGTDEMTDDEAVELGAAADAESDEELAEAAEPEEAEEVEEAAGAFDSGVPIEEADEAEAAEAFDEEVEAAESAEGDELAEFDEEAKPAKSQTKLAKKTRVHDEDELEDLADEEEEEPSAKKKGKKGKKGKEKATVAAAPVKSGYGCITVLIALMFPFILIGGLGAGAWFGAPDQIRDLAKAQLDLHEKAPPPPPPTALEKANGKFAKRDYAAAIAELQNAKAPEEFNVRGQARWLAYAEKNPVPDKDAQEVKDALSDLDKGNNKALAAQINHEINAPAIQKDLTEKLAAVNAAKEKVETDLAKTKKEKDDADQKIDNLADALAKGKVIEDKSKLDPAAVQKVLQELNTDKTTLAMVNKLLKDAEIKGAGDEGVKEIIKLRTDADKNIADINKALADAKAKEKGDKGVVEIADARDKMTKDRDDLLKTVGDAFKEFIDGKIVPEGSDARKTIVEGAKLARQKAESPLAIPLAQLGMSLGGIGSGTSKSVEKTFDLAKLVSELGFYRTREPFIQTPEAKMDTHLALLADRKKNDAKELAAITREADWVLSKESKADAESRSKARFVQGLAARNLENFGDARKAFADTIESLKSIQNAGPWSKAVGVAQSEITDPTVYYIPRIEAFRAEHAYKPALDEANTALKAMPDDARLYVQRGLTRFEKVRDLGTKIPDDAQKEIRADAALAAKDEKVAAQSAHLIGMLDEAMQNWPGAEKNYREALKLHQGPAEDAGKYRISLARLLLRDRTNDAAAPAPAAPEEKKKEEPKKDDAKEEKKDSAMNPAQDRAIAWHPLSTLVASLVIAQPPGDDDLDDAESRARLDETIKLAKELIDSKNDKLKGQGYMLLGSALSKRGKRTEGLKEYAKGLKLVYPGIETKEIDQLINDHPAFAQPDIAGTPNPVMAERHFGEGMHLYWSMDYEKAEAQFKSAVRYFDRDARYQYYLGLSQLAQKTKLKRDAAYYAFEVGARLEAKAVTSNPYAARDINMSLERIQGPVREVLNSFRVKALDPEAETKTPTPN